MNLEDGGIDNNMGWIISRGLKKLSKLEKLNLSLEDNYIDNYGFGIILEDFEMIKEVILNVVLNNIV